MSSFFAGSPNSGGVSSWQRRWPRFIDLLCHWAVCDEITAFAGRWYYSPLAPLSSQNLRQHVGQNQVLQRAAAPHGLLVNAHTAQQRWRRSRGQQWPAEPICSPIFQSHSKSFETLESYMLQNFTFILRYSLKLWDCRPKEALTDLHTRKCSGGNAYIS